VTFNCQEGVNNVLAINDHVILDRKVQCSLALSKREAKLITNEKCKKKFYVGGLSQRTTDAHLRNYFSQFGHLITVYLIYDRHTNKTRCFGFVEFQDEGIAEEVFKGRHFLDEREVVLKFQVRKPSNKEMKYQKEGGEFKPGDITEDSLPN